MKDVVDDLALIVRNAIAYIKELERQVNELKRAAEPMQEPVAMLWQHRETGRTRLLMPNERTATDVAYAWDVVGPLYLAPPQRKPLTEEEIKKLLIESAGMTVTFSAVDLSLARAIERVHGIK